MAVQKNIIEKSSKIDSTKKIIIGKSKKIDQVSFVEEKISDEQWKNKKFEFNDKLIRIETVFSGIGC